MSSPSIPHIHMSNLTVEPSTINLNLEENKKVIQFVFDRLNRICTVIRNPNQWSELKLPEATYTDSFAKRVTFRSLSISLWGATLIFYLYRRSIQKQLPVIAGSAAAAFLSSLYTLFMQRRFKKETLEYKDKYDKKTKINKKLFKNVSYLINGAWFTCSDALINSLKDQKVPTRQEAKKLIDELLKNYRKNTPSDIVKEVEKSEVQKAWMIFHGELFSQLNRLLDGIDEDTLSRFAEQSTDCDTLVKAIRRFKTGRILAPQEGSSYIEMHYPQKSGVFSKFLTFNKLNWTYLEPQIVSDRFNK